MTLNRIAVHALIVVLDVGLTVVLAVVLTVVRVSFGEACVFVTLSCADVQMLATLATLAVLAVILTASAQTLLAAWPCASAISHFFPMIVWSCLHGALLPPADSGADIPDSIQPDVCSHRRKISPQACQRPFHACLLSPQTRHLKSHPHVSRPRTRR